MLVYQRVSNKMQQVTWIYATGITGITGIRKHLGFERQTFDGSKRLKLGRPLEQALSEKAFNANVEGGICGETSGENMGKPYTRIYQDIPGYTRIYQDIPGFPEFSPHLLSSFQPAVPPCPIDCSKVSWMFRTAILQLPMPALCCPCKINVALCSVGICTM